MSAKRYRLLLLSIVSTIMFASCTVGPMKTPVQTGMVLYTEGARSHTATVQLQVPPSEVHAALLRLVGNDPEIKLVNRDDKRFLVEAERGADNVTAQATPIGQNSTLLFIWATAGKKGESGKDLALRSVTRICKELGVQCTMNDL